MQKPKLRLLETFPVEHRGEQMLMLRDPMGLSEHCAVIPHVAVAILSLCDGERTLAEVAQEFRVRTGRAVEPARIRGLIDQMDQALLLDSPRFEAHRREIEDGFLHSKVRLAAHAGESYADDPRELAASLDQHTLRATGPGSKPRRNSNNDQIRALISPHIDFNRGGGAYAHAWRPLMESRFRPDVVVVFGTDHNGQSEPFTLTAKAYDTPLGAVETDQRIVSKLAQAFGLRLFREELHHRREHSIEFQAVWLRYVYGDDCPPMVPILTGSLHEFVESGGDPRTDLTIERFFATLKDLLRGKRALIVAGADMAHVGPHFGDEQAYGVAERADVKRADDQALAAAARGDASGFFASIAAIGDQNRVCGLSPIYATLRMLEDGPEVAGQLVAYDQCVADDKNASFVSIASMVLR